MSKDGTVLAVGGPYNRDDAYNKNELGYVRVFKWSGKRHKWIQLGKNIVGVAKNGQLGYSVALSGDGSVVVMGAPGNKFSD